MTVKVSKPAINVREELADLKKPTGIAGEAMLAAETPQEQQALIGVGRRNLILNGDFKISQRGDFSSATAITHDNYYVDRWSVRVTNVTANIQHIIGSNASPGYPYKASNSLRLTATNTASGVLRHLQRTEGFLDGQTLTFSAWVKSNSPNARLFQYQHDGQYRVSSKAHSGNGQWEFLSVTAINKATTANQIYNDAAIASSTFGNVSITTGDYIEISEAQLEINNVVTPFEHRSYGEELLLCSRYYTSSFQTIEPQNGSLGAPNRYYSPGWKHSSGSGIVGSVNNFPVPMRTTPTITFYRDTGVSVTDGRWGYYNSTSWQTANAAMSTQMFSHLGFTPHLPNSETSITQNYLLLGGWTADAEL